MGDYRVNRLSVQVEATTEMSGFPCLSGVQS